MTDGTGISGQGSYHPGMALVDRVRAVFGMAPRARFDEPRVIEFSAVSPVYPIDQLAIWAQSRRGGHITREDALSVPSVLRGRNIICSISTLPLQAVDEENRVQDHPLLRQVDANVPNVTTLAMTVEDLLFESVAWWRITGFDHEGMPFSAVRYAPDQVSMTPPADYRHGYLPSGLPTEPSLDAGVRPGRFVWMGGEPVPFDEVVRFDSPNPPLLVAGKRAISRAIALDDAADLYAGNPQARGYFAPADPAADPADDEDIIQALDDFASARAKRLDGYVPAALKYNPISNPTPVELQLVEMQKRADLGIANALGMDPEDLGISTTSRTYQNGVDRRQDRVNDVLASYMSAITDRLGMPDVTRSGVRVRFWLDDYLKADPKTRAEVQQIYSAMGATDAAEIRQEEGKPPRTIRPVVPAARPIPATVGDPVRQITATQDAVVTFAADLRPADAGITFDSDAVAAAFTVDTVTRTMTGLVIPWGEQASKFGRMYRFARGGQRYGKLNRIKFLEDHDFSLAFGRAVSIEDRPEGLVIAFKIAPGAHGDRMLALGADEVKDGLSPGVIWDPADEIPDPLFPGGRLVRQYHLQEVSQLANPAFTNARLISVQASTTGKATMDTCPRCGAQLTPGVAHTCPAPATTDPTPTVPAAAPVALFSNDMAAQFAAFLESQRPAPDPAPAPAAPAARPTVDPTRTPVPAAVTFVAEPLPYQFSYEGVPGARKHVFRADAEFDFSTDLYALLKSQETGRDYGPQIGRLNALIGAQFADITRADVTDKTNPNNYRPDMWLPQMDYPTPLWDFVASGSTDGTKFDIPKFNTSGGLVGPATEGTEPATGTFTVQLQTITPTSVWGKVGILRQAWRAGGNPQLSGILWDQMLREYYEDREASVATFLNTLTAAADITITGTPLASPTNDNDQTSVNDLEMALALLQFARGGNRFRAFAVHVDLFKLLARVKDDAGRPLYPMINPMNANGTSETGFSTINIAGTTAVPSYALGTSGLVSANSWLFDPAKVRGWASAPERLFWDFGPTIQTANIPQLSSVTVGIYGDVAMGNTDINGVRQVLYDPSV